MNRKVGKSFSGAMHHVGNEGNANNSNRPPKEKEKRLSYVLNNADETKHSAGINCLSLLKSVPSDGFDYLFTGSRDSTLKRWALVDDMPSFSAKFESHVDWVNDVVLVSDNVLVSCSSDTTIKTWNALSNGTCTRTLRRHKDYVTCLATAENDKTVVASGGLGGEVFIWDIEAATAKCNDTMDGDNDNSNGANASGNSLPVTTNSRNNISMDTTETQEYTPIGVEGCKESVYALAMNEEGTLLVSGGTEQVVRVWDPRSGSKTSKLKGHTDNIRTLLLDSTGRFCISGSSDSMIRLWDIGQQRCIHSYAVHTDSVWALASTSTFSHVYSGGRDLSVYVTDLQTRESALLCTEENPIQRLALHDDNIWVTSTDSSVHRWSAEGRNPRNIFQRDNSLLNGNLSLSKARVSLDESTPDPVYKQPTLTIPGIPAIVQHALLNNKRHVLTKDTSGSVKLWEITKGALVEDYGNVSLEEKVEDLFEKVDNIPPWFTVDTRFGCLSVHFDSPQCFLAEMYSEDLNIVGKTKDDKVNMGQETLKGLFGDWLRKRKQRMECAAPSNGELVPGKDIGIRNHTPSSIDGSCDTNAFEFSDISFVSIITEGSHGGQWGKKLTHLDGTEDEKDFPGWLLECLLNDSLPFCNENTNTK